MKEMLKPVASCLLILTFIAFGHTKAVTAQDREVRLISAKAGGVNFVSGDVTFRKAKEAGGQSLTAKDNLETGDVVKTGGGGRAEILLNPGSYIRLAENSEFMLSNASLDDLRIKLTKGSAVLEATGYSDVETSILVETPQTQVSIIRSGIYRINVLPSDVTEVVVRKGRAVIGGNKAAPVKGDRKARVVGSAVEVVKYDKKREKDAFDDWSKERGESLAEANRKLSDRSVNTLLASYRMDNFWSARYQPYGLWFFDSQFGCYTFLPFHARWSSPYGRSYNNMLYGYGYGYYGYGNNNGRLVMTSSPPMSNPGGTGRPDPISQRNPSMSDSGMGGRPDPISPRSPQASDPGVSRPDPVFQRNPSMSDPGMSRPDPVAPRSPQPMMDQPRPTYDRGVDSGAPSRRAEPDGGAQRPRDQ